MKKTTLIFLAFLMLIPSFGARKNTKTPIPTFPDGTVISDWFKEGDDAKLENLGKNPIVITSPIVRMYFKKLTEDYYPDLIVVSYNEIDTNVELQSVGMVTA